MPRRFLTLLACLASLGLTSSARADIDIFINFDVDPNGVPLESPAVINEVYTVWGVTLGSTPGASCGSEVYASSECLSGAAPTSSPNIISHCSGCTDISENAHGLVVAIFNTPADSVCITTIGFETGARGVLRAYDASHNLLAEDISDPELAMEVLCVASPEIHTVEFSGYQDEFAWFDDMQVSFAEVAVEGVTWSGVKAGVLGE